MNRDDVWMTVGYVLATLLVIAAVIVIVAAEIRGA